MLRKSIQRGRNERSPFPSRFLPVSFLTPPNNELTLLSHTFQLAVKEWEWVAELRQSEILNHQWCNVGLFRRTITLLEQKNGGRDTLPVNAKTLDVLQARAKV